MTLLEILISIMVLTFVFSFLIVNFSNVLNVDLSYDIILTAVYSGLWKSDLIKEYFSRTCNVKNKRVMFSIESENVLNGITILPFNCVKSGTFFNGITIEPIMFEVSKGR
ncbi:MAG: hypothetical protein ACP5PP_06435 [Fervidobacterium sp.]